MKLVKVIGDLLTRAVISRTSGAMSEELYKGMPASVRKLRKSAKAKLREKSRQDWKEKHAPVR